MINFIYLTIGVLEVIALVIAIGFIFYDLFCLFNSKLQRSKRVVKIGDLLFIIYLSLVCLKVLIACFMVETIWEIILNIALFVFMCSINYYWINHYNKKYKDEGYFNFK